MILHCMERSLWLMRKELVVWGQEELAKDGFIHNSTPEYFHRVAKRFKQDNDYVILVIDESKLLSTVLYEESLKIGGVYPHIYGLINTSAVIKVLPFLRDTDGNYMKNPEFSDITEK